MEIPDGIEEIIYLDNAATVYPKPPEVLDKALDRYKRFGVNPGRSGFDLCLIGSDYIETTRRELTAFFNGDSPERLCFGPNASDALNLLIQGIAEPGCHILTTILEHNSVIRPLNHLAKEKGCTVEFVSCGKDCRVDPEDFRRRMKKNTGLVVVNHASNVVGVVQPVAEIGSICREHGVPFVIDAAQTAGILPVDVKAMNLSALAFTGHKSLLAPTGVGGCYVTPETRVRITRSGGTGVRSAEPFQLEEYPWRLEVGTPNLLGIIGLHFSRQWITEKGRENIFRHEMELFRKLQEGLAAVDGVRIHGTLDLEHRLPVISFSVNGIDAADVGTLLDVDHSVAVRTGLHCAPLIHRHLGTAPRGSVRMSIGPSNTAADVEAAIGAVEAVVSGPRKG